MGADEEQTLNNQDPESSAESDDNTQSQSGEDSSSSQETTETLADVVARAANESESQTESGDENAGETTNSEEESEAEAEEETEEQQSQETSEEGEEGESNDEDPLHKHPRWIERQKELEALRPLAKQVEELNNWKQKFQVSDEQWKQTQQFIEAINTNPLKAREMLAPMWEQLNKYTGDVLPQDLQQAVDNGDITEEYAKRIVAAEAQKEAQVMQQKQQEHQTQLEQQQQMQRQLHSSLTSWEQQMRAKDPEFELKNEQIQARFLHLVSTQNGYRSVEDAVKLANQAYKDVNALLTKVAPKPSARKLLPKSGGLNAKAKLPEPKTFEEVVKRAEEESLAKQNA